MKPNKIINLDIKWIIFGQVFPDDVRLFSANGKTMNWGFGVIILLN
ncbi:MAG: hypothetical protein ACRC6S_14480 [Shewanella sp.]